MRTIFPSFQGVLPGAPFEHDWGTKQVYERGATLVQQPSRAGQWVNLRSGALRLRWVLGRDHSLLKGFVVAPALFWLQSPAGRPSPVVLTALCDASVEYGAIVRAEGEPNSPEPSSAQLLACATAAEALYLARLRHQFEPLADRVGSLVLAYHEVRRRTFEGEGEEFVALTNQTVTADLGVSVRSVSATFTRLHGEGLIARVQGGVVVKDWPRLIARSGESARALFPFTAPT